MSKLTPKERLIRALEGPENETLRNFKMFRGHYSAVSVEDLCDEVHAALRAISLGTAERSESFGRDTNLKQVKFASL